MFFPKTTSRTRCRSCQQIWSQSQITLCVTWHCRGVRGFWNISQKVTLTFCLTRTTLLSYYYSFPVVRLS